MTPVISLIVINAALIVFRKKVARIYFKNYSERTSRIYGKLKKYNIEMSFPKVDEKKFTVVLIIGCSMNIVALLLYLFIAKAF